MTTPQVHRTFGTHGLVEDYFVAESGTTYPPGELVVVHGEMEGRLDTEFPLGERTWVSQEYLRPVPPISGHCMVSMIFFCAEDGCNMALRVTVVDGVPNPAVVLADAGWTGTEEGPICHRCSGNPAPERG